MPVAGSIAVGRSTEVERLCALAVVASDSAASASRAARMVVVMAPSSLDRGEGVAAEIDAELGAFGALHADAEHVAAGAVDGELARRIALGLELAHHVVGRGRATGAVEQHKLEHFWRIGP